jgi:cellulose synthase operon protein C
MLIRRLLALRPWLAVALLVSLAACDSAEERAKQHYENGIRLVQEHQPDKALIEFRNATQMDPAMAQAYFEMAKVFESQRVVVKALNNYLKTIEIDPNHVEALTRAGNIMIAANHVDEAEPRIDAAYQLAPNNVDVLIARALISLRRGDLDAAVAGANKVLELAPANPKAGLILATERYQRNDPKAALQIIDRFLEVNSTDVSLNVFKIQVLAKLADRERLAAHLRHMTELYPNSLEVRRLLARWYLSEKMYAEGEAELRKLLELEPTSMPAVRNLIQFIADTKGEAAAEEEIATQVSRTTIPQQKIALQAMLADIKYKNGERDKAYSILDSVLSADYPPEMLVDVQLMKGQFLAAEGRFDEALKAADAVIETDTKNAVALGLRAAVYSEQQRNQEAVTAIRSALNEAPRNQKLRRLAARIHMRNGDSELAAENMALAVTLSKYDPQYVQEYVDELGRRGQLRQMEGVLADAIAVHPKNKELLAALAAVRLRLQDWSGAGQVSEMLRKLDAEDADRIEAMVLSGRKRYTESIELLERLAQDNASDPSLMPALVQAYINAGRTDDARAFIDKVMQENPQNDQAVRVSGALYETVGNLEAAERDYRKAIVIAPANATGYIVLVRFLRSHDREGDIEEILRSGVANAPENVSLHLQLAEILLKKNDYDAAIQQFETVYALDPKSLAAANNLASILADYRAKEPGTVERAYDIAQRLSTSTEPAHMDTYGWILYLRGEYSQALRSLLPAVQRLPNNPWTQYHTGMTYLKLKRPEDAREHLKAAAAAGGDKIFPLREQLAQALAEIENQKTQ